MRKFPHFAVALIFLHLCSITRAYSSEPDSEPENPVGEISLHQALALVMLQSPALHVYAWDIRAAEARAIQARLRPNPQLSIEIEDLRLGDGPGSTARRIGASSSRISDTLAIPTAIGEINLPIRGRSLTPEFERSTESGTESGLREAEITLSLSQLVELGGKRAKRIQLANRERDVAVWDYEVTRANVLSETAKSFYAVVSAQENLRLAEELGALAKQTAGTVAARVEAGKVSPIELSTAEAEFGSVKLGMEQARQQLDAARYELASHWGATSPQFSEASGSLGSVREIPTLGALRADIEALPDLARWTAEVAQREASIVVERANALPDLTITLGLRSTGIGTRNETGVSVSGAGDFGYTRSSVSSDDSRDHSVVIGASLPLPIFNRNQGRVLEAESLAAKAADQRRAAEVNLHKSLGIAHCAAEAAFRETELLDREVLPKAKEAFDAIVEGYRQGKFGLMDVLLAERTLFAAQRQQLEARTRFHQHALDVERLTGRATTEASPEDQL
ncbi:MAG: TolC family protein [Candidatus Hydrogenedentes bacterium]|nr:TolC family protein [Candidatus Hydrogenedentota bacterium]